MEPLKQAAQEGVVITCADGWQWCIYPIPAAFKGDWPEQCAMASTDESSCPVCEQDYEHRSDYPNLAHLHNPTNTLKALRRYDRSKDMEELKGLGLKPWWPWWADIPFTNFHMSIMPDLLHQLYQGLIKMHAIAWSQKVISKSKLNQCFKSMPKAAGMRHFSKGISKIQQWTGRESKEMAKQLLPIIAGQGVNSNFIALIQSITNFTFRVHQSWMTDSEVNELECSLLLLHEKKSVLKTLKIYKLLKSLNHVKKLHMASHYSRLIREMGTLDGYSTEGLEHLHMIYTKRGWHASNKVKPLPQMIKFIQRYEAIRIHRVYMNIYYKLPDREWVDSRVVYGKDEDAIAEDGVNYNLWDDESGKDGTKVQWNPNNGGE
ncbi:hypothetical protein OPQ81_009163 [Rhizoctonia solani]|nr:hypothetical protein OPQ81_009163 [Rhizoctonia solani]